MSASWGLCYGGLMPWISWLRSRASLFEWLRHVIVLLVVPLLVVLDLLLDLLLGHTLHPTVVG